MPENGKNRNHYAIVIAIAAYVSIDSLDHPLKDAQLFVEWLMSPKGGNLPKENIKFLKSPHPMAEYVGTHIQEGDDHRENGDLDRALECYQEAMKVYRAKDYLIGQADLFSTIGEIYIAKGDSDEACKHFIESNKLKDLAEQRGGKIRPIFKHFEEALDVIGLEKDTFQGDRLYLYFAGHGVGISVNKLAMLLANANTKRTNQCIDFDKTKDWFDNKRIFREVVYVIDSCRNRLDELKLTRLDPGFTVAYKNHFPETEDIVQSAIFATTDRKKVKDKGAFTERVIEHLNGNGASSDGIVTTETLRLYLKDKIPDADVQTFPQSTKFIRLNKITPDNIEKQFRIFPSRSFNGRLYLSEENKPYGEMDANGCSRESPWIVNLKLGVTYTLHASTRDIPISFVANTTSDEIVFEVI